MGTVREIRVLRQSAGDALTDTALSRVLLEQVAAGSAPETLRVYRPLPNVAFGRQDAVAPGYAKAVTAARRQGFEAVERLAGGRAAVFHEHTVAFAWELADASPRDGIRRRFQELAGLVVEALAGLGVDARVGEVPGEYCPGEFSVNARGERKLMGVGQRIVKGAVHIGGVVVVEDAERVRDVLLPVYAAMELPWRPETTGAVAGEVPGAGFDDVATALIDAFASRFAIEEARMPADLLADARGRREEFLPRR